MPPSKLYVGQWADVVRGVIHRGEGQASWDKHKVYALMENFNLGKYANSELAWTLNTNNTWWWWTNWHRIKDQGAKR